MRVGRSWSSTWSWNCSIPRTHRASLVDPYREHLRKRRSEDPAVPVKHLFEEIKALGFTGCLNLLHKYINQGRADADRSHISPRRFARMLLTRPDNLKAEHHELLAKLTAACPEMTQLATLIRDVAQLLTPQAGNAAALTHWIAQARAVDLPDLHAFTRGLERDRDAVNYALTLPYSNGPTDRYERPGHACLRGYVRHRGPLLG